MEFLIVVVVIAVAAWFFLKRTRQTASPEGGTPVADLPGTGHYDFDIVGESHYQDALELICGGRDEEGAEKYVEASLYLEDTNPHDNQAVRVEIDGKTVGYLSREHARSYRRQLHASGHPRVIGVCKAVIVGGWRGDDDDWGHFGVKLDIPVKHV